MPGKEEQRRHPRNEITGLKGTLAFTMEANVLNVSLSGMAVLTHAPVRIGRPYAIHLRNGQGSIPLLGSARWCWLRATRKNGGGEIEPVYEAGLVFHNVLSAEGRELVDLLRCRVTVEPAVRLAGRFTARTDDAATLESSHPFLVRQIGLSGMLVATEVFPEPESICNIEMHLASELFRSGGRIASVRAAETTDRLVHTGVEFVETAERPRRLLEEFVKDQFRPPITLLITVGGKKIITPSQWRLHEPVL
jgi:hypothetical protein